MHLRCFGSSSVAARWYARSLEVFVKRKGESDMKTRNLIGVVMVGWLGISWGLIESVARDSVVTVSSAELSNIRGGACRAGTKRFLPRRQERCVLDGVSVPARWQ